MIDGAFVGLVLGLGLLAIWWSLWEQEGSAVRRGRIGEVLDRLRDDLVVVGLGTVPPIAVPLLSAGLGLVVAAALWAVSGAVVPSVTIGTASSGLPVLLLRSAARRRATALREVWPEAVDHINSAIRAGLSLPEALVQLSRKGPEQLRPAFTEFGRDYQASGDFAASLDRLKVRLADPVGDRIVEVGGRDPSARLNILAGNGSSIVATTWGDTLSVLATPFGVAVASEPFDDDPAWRDVPDHSLLRVTLDGVTITDLGEP